MFHLKKICFSVLLASSTFAHAAPGITDITFTGTGMSMSGSWAVVDAPAYWSIRAILMDGAHNTIGTLSPTITLNTASAASYPTGFQVTLGAIAPADAIVVVYRSKMPFGAGDTVDKAEYPGLCQPIGCSAGGLIVPVSGDLLNTAFVSDVSAMPVRLQEFSVE